jgi:hypothetical protein
LLQQGGAATLSESQASQRSAPGPMTPIEPATRSRDSLRSRDRGDR